MLLAGLSVESLNQVNFWICLKNECPRLFILFPKKQLLQNITEAGTTFRVFGEATKELKD